MWEEFFGHPPDYRFTFDVTRLGTGRYQITTNHPGYGHGVVHASTIGDIRCVVGGSAVGRTYSILSVRCYAASGALADTSLYVVLQ